MGPEPSPDFVKLLTCVADPWLPEDKAAEQLVQHMPLSVAYQRLGTFDGGQLGEVRDLVAQMHDASMKNKTFNTLGNAAGQVADQNLDASQYNTTTFTTRNVRGQITSSRTVQTGTSADDVLGWMLMRGLGAVASQKGKELVVEAFKHASESLLRMAPQMYHVDRTESKMIATTASEKGIAFTNISGHDLTNLTLHVEMVHFWGAPDPFASRFMYVPSLKEGASIYISPWVTRNLHMDRDTLARCDRPDIATKTDSIDEAWLIKAGGLVEVRVSAWSREAVQTDAVERFPDIAARAAAFEMRAVRRVLNHELPYGPGAKHNEKVEKTFIVEGSKRVLALAAPHTALADDAQDILNDPDGAEKKQRDRIAERSNKNVAGKLNGRFRLQDDRPKDSKGMPFAMAGHDPFAEMRKQWDGVKKLNSEGAAILELKIVPELKDSIVGYLYNPGNEASPRIFMGQPPDFDSGKRSIILWSASGQKLKDLGKALDKELPDQPDPKSPDKENFCACAGSIILELTDTEATGEARAGNFRFTLKFQRTPP